MYEIIILILASNYDYNSNFFLNKLKAFLLRGREECNKRETIPCINKFYVKIFTIYIILHALNI